MDRKDLEDPGGIRPISARRRVLVRDMYLPFSSSSFCLPLLIIFYVARMSRNYLSPLMLSLSNAAAKLLAVGARGSISSEITRILFFSRYLHFLLYSRVKRSCELFSDLELNRTIYRF